MLEQAVYAGRNHTLSLAAAFTLAACTQAQAADVARVPLGSEIAALVAGADGGAWVGVNPRGLRPPQIGRADPDGRFRIVPGAGIAVFGATLGPDGRAWFDTGENLLRVDAAGTVAPTPAPLDADQALAAGPDGTLWMTARDRLADRA